MTCRKEAEEALGGPPGLRDHLQGPNTALSYLTWGQDTVHIPGLQHAVVKLFSDSFQLLIKAGSHHHVVELLRTQLLLVQNTKQRETLRETLSLVKYRTKSDLSLGQSPMALTECDVMRRHVLCCWLRATRPTAQRLKPLNISNIAKQAGSSVMSPKSCFSDDLEGSPLFD